jgi:dCTP deaminase
MILSGEEIRRLHGSEIVIDPFDPGRINPNSYNLTLHDELLVYEEVVLDVAAPNRYARLNIPAEGLTLHPGQLYLGRSVERTETRRLVPRIQGRSSLARLGLLICPGGSLGSVGYCGTWTLEMFVVQPVKIYPFMQVCQIYFHELCGEIGEYAEGKYHNSSEIQTSQMYREFGGDCRNQQLELSFDNLHKSEANQ